MKRRLLVPNQSLQRTKPPVTVRACARPAPDVFAAEAGVRQSTETFVAAEFESTQRNCRWGNNVKTILVAALFGLMASGRTVHAAAPEPWVAGYMRDWWSSDCIIGPDERNVIFTGETTCEISPWPVWSDPEGEYHRDIYVYFPESFARSLVVHVPSDADLWTGAPFLLMRTDCSDVCNQYVILSHGPSDSKIEASGPLSAVVQDPDASIRWMALTVDTERCTVLYSRDGVTWEVLVEGASTCTEPRNIGFGVFAGRPSGPVVFEDIAIGAVPLATWPSTWGSLKAQFR